MKRESGITLIILIVTIIVLLILVGISLNLSIGNNGIINKTTDGKTASKEAEAKEDLRIKMTQYYDTNEEIDSNKLQEFLEEKSDNIEKVSTADSFPIMVKYDDVLFEILESDDIISSYDIKKLGDVNFDGKVDEDDINLMVDFLINGSTFTEKQKGVIDLNEDGVFNGLDLNGIYFMYREITPDSNFTNVKGDVNLDGRINEADTKLIERCLARLIALNDDQIERGDIDGNGSLESIDATLIERVTCYSEFYKEL